jgi:peptidoglycan/xylan/chitin deacetylase (PgdA/CDA1 family)
MTRSSLLTVVTALLVVLSLHAQNPTEASIPILVYHRFDPTTSASTTVTTATFESQLDFLADHHYSILPLTSVTDIVLRKAQSPHAPIIAITVDDGHISVYTVLYPIIKQRRIPITLFIYPSAISNTSYALTWEQLKEMRASGLVDIESHTYWHPNFNKERSHRTPTDYAKFVSMQLTRSREELDKRLGTHVTLLAWPYGIVDPALEQAAAQAGYLAAFGYDGELARPGDRPFNIHRIPVSNFAHGSAFERLLCNAQSHTGRAQSIAPRNFHP